MNLFFPDPEPPIINILYGWAGIYGQLGLCSVLLFCNIIKINSFCITSLYCYIEYFLFHLLDLLLIPYAYVSIKSIDYILLSLFELEAILLISSLKTLCISFLDLCYVFNIYLFFYEFFMIFLKANYVNLFNYQIELLLNGFYNCQI